MLHYSRKEHVLYTLRKCTKYKFVYWFYITFHIIFWCVSSGERVYERTLTTTVIELISSLIGRGG